MVGSIRIYAFSAIVLAALAAFSLPSDDGAANADAKDFIRCDACHIDNADTTRSGPHYSMKCSDCHELHGFQENTHSAAIPECKDCHSGIKGEQHKKLRYFSDPLFVVSPGITENDKATYISVFKPVNSSI